ncbi:MAG: ABC transporter permease [Deltaproteobacteria bacterium]|nr:MAG: ABC transporter permease [Deltaproteobacteria bacterium]
MLRKRLVTQNVRRVIRYIVIRALAVGFSLVAGVFLTIIVANMGGYVDAIKKAQITEQVGMSVYQNPAYRNLNTEQLRELIDQKVQLEFRRLGLDKPFIRFDSLSGFVHSRAFLYLLNALSLNLGRAEHIYSSSGSKRVWLIILERLPYSVLLFTTASLLVFFSSLYVALILSRRYGSIWDKLSVALAPLSTAPSWFYGIILILIFAAILRVLPFGGLVDAPPPESKFLYALSVIKHMILPLLGWFISGIFIGVYNWRTFFLIYSSEDYVEMARAKGVPGRLLERRYILRPTLPAIITSFALMLISAWMGAIITETVFNWPGLGSLYMSAISQFDTPVIVGLTVIYAYLLAITVFILDVVYAIVDPRIKVAGGSIT